MDAPQQSALAALQSGQHPGQVVAMFMSAGWPERDARAVVESVQRMMPPQAPSPQPSAPQPAAAYAAASPSPALYGTPPSTTPSPQPAASGQAAASPGGSWALAVGLVAGLVGVALIVVMFFAPFFDGLGPRQRVDELGNGGAFLRLVLAPVLPWLVLLAMVLTHHIGYGRRWAAARAAGLVQGRGRRASLIVLDWILVGLVPVLTFLAVFCLWIAWIAMGVMCGEAVSADCGM